MSKTDSRYPVRSEQPLERIPRRILLAEKRDLSTIPRPEPGTALLFKVDGRYASISDRSHLTGKEPELIDAVAVAVVDVRPRMVTTSFPIPSKSAADDFILRVTFTCQVTDPKTIAASGLTDLTPILRQHLVQDRKLLQLGMDHSIDQLNHVRELVVPRVQAIVSIRPPTITGLSIQLSDVDVLTPQSLRQHETTLRNTRWQGDVDRTQRRVNGEAADWIADYSQRGTDHLAALAAANGDLTVGELLARQDKVREDNLGRLSEAISVLAERGHLDRIALDPQSLFDKLADSIGGPELPPSERAPLEGAHAGRPAPRRLRQVSSTSDPDDDRVEAFEDDDD